MPIYELTLNGFSFGQNLPEPRSTFRFLTGVRYITKDGGFDTVRAVAPGLDTYWECESSNKSSPFYVRAQAAPEFDMARIDPWDRLIFTIRAKSLHSLQIKVIDIEKTGGLLDKIKDYAGSLIQGFMGVVKTKATGALPGGAAFVKDTLGEAVGDVESLAISTLSGMKGKDSLLFKQSLLKATLPAASGDFVIEGVGLGGNYKIKLHLEVIPDA